MDASIVSALAALTGAAVGGLTSGMANWLNQRIQVRAQWVLHEKTRRQILYRDFIEDAAKCYIDALQHDEANIPGLVGLYAKLSAMGLAARRKVTGIGPKRAEIIVPGVSVLLRFLQQKVPVRGGIHTQFTGEVVSDLKHRPEGVRIKHAYGLNSVKLYDKQGSPVSYTKSWSSRARM